MAIAAMGLKVFSEMPGAVGLAGMALFLSDKI
jgi:hypothetical protein